MSSMSAVVCCRSIIEPLPPLLPLVLQPPPAAAFPADFRRETIDALLEGIVDASE